jgi:hypothetical protein
MNHLWGVASHCRRLILVVGEGVEIGDKRMPEAIILPRGQPGFRRDAVTYPF